MVMIPKDKMTPRERMTAFARGEPIDRVLCQPSLGQNSALLFGQTTKAFNNSPEVMETVLWQMFQAFRPDGVNVSPSLQALPEALGAKLEFPAAGAPVVAASGLRDYSQLDDIEPADPYTSGRLPYYLQTLQRLQDRIGDEVCLASSVSGPFTAAVLFCGTEKLLKDMVKNPEPVHKALELTTLSLMKYIDAVCGMGFNISLSEPLVSSTVISRKRYNEFAKPYLKRLLAYAEEKYQKKLSTHICGRTREIWPEIVDTGFTAFSLDNIEDMGEARQELGDYLTIIGNVSPVDTLMNGSVQDVYDEARACIQKAGQSKKGFVLSSGCEIPAQTKAENIQALMDAARIYGQIPISL